MTDLILLCSAGRTISKLLNVASLLILVSHIDQLKPALPKSALAEGEVVWQDAEGFQADYEYANLVADRWCRRLAYNEEERLLFLRQLELVEKVFSQLIQDCEEDFYPKELEKEHLTVHFRSFSDRAKSLWADELKNAAMSLFV